VRREQHNDKEYRDCAEGSIFAGRTGVTIGWSANTTRRYAAFISYSHDDEPWAKWLQQALERYRIPRRLRRQHSNASLPSRLYPVFRDREELASASDLSGAIRSALDDSDALVVVCSPAAARSRWVNEEIRFFRRSGRADRVLCLLVAGDPQADSSDCAFPPALLQTDAGLPLPEPLAADVTAHGDGKRGALLKIVAGIIGVSLDELKRRDAQRQIRVRGAIATGSTAVSLVTIGLAVVAQLARQDAEIRRVQAEGLIGFMLGDLRAKLEPLGRLDLLDAVGERAMEYFAVLGGSGTEQEVLARAMALRQIGEVRFNQGLLEPALEAFEQSRDVAQALYAGARDNNDYLFELGQAEYWVGYVALQQSRLEQTHASLTKYMEYSRELLAREPANPKYQRELAYAYSNLGTAALERFDAPAALGYFLECMSLYETLVAAAPDDLDLRNDRANGYSWLGTTYIGLRRLADSEDAFRSAVSELAQLHATGSDQEYSERYSANLRLLATVKLHRGELADAEALLRTARDLIDALVEHDPQNAVWRTDRASTAYEQAVLRALSGDAAAARNGIEQTIADLSKVLLESTAGDVRVVEYLALAESTLARQALDAGLVERALELGAIAVRRMFEAVDDASTVRARTALAAAVVAERYGRILQATGDEVAAASTWTRALDLLESQPERTLVQLAVERQLARHLRRDAVEAERARQLEAAGFADPRYR